jgi:hypothetical protein
MSKVEEVLTREIDMLKGYCIMKYDGDKSTWGINLTITSKTTWVDKFIDKGKLTCFEKQVEIARHNVVAKQMSCLKGR